MSSTALHLFPRLVTTYLFPAHLPLPPRHEWRSGKGSGGCDQYRTASPCCSFLLTLFPGPSMGFSQALQSFRKYHMLQSGLHGLLRHSCSTLVSQLGAWSTSCTSLTWVPQDWFSHFFPPSLLLGNVLSFLECLFPEVLSLCPRGSAMPSWSCGTGCVHPRAALATPAPSPGQCLGRDTLCSNLSKTRGCSSVDGKMPFLDTGNILLYALESSAYRGVSRTFFKLQPCAGHHGHCLG